MRARASRSLLLADESARVVVASGGDAMLLGMTPVLRDVLRAALRRHEQRRRCGRADGLPMLARSTTESCAAIPPGAKAVRSQLVRGAASCEVLPRGAGALGRVAAESGKQIPALPAR